MANEPRAWIVLLALTALSGCGPSNEPQSRSGRGDASDSATTATHPEVVEPAATFDSTVTPRGFGPVQVGMTLAEAEARLGMLLELVPPGEPCSYAFVGGQPGIALMVIDGRIARVDIQRGTVRTAEGAAIGDSEERIRDLYPSRVEVQPHKYIEGHYLIVRPTAPADSGYRVIFETDGRRVLRYRAGRMPEVRWIEGCS